MILTMQKKQIQKHDIDYVEEEFDTLDEDLEAPDDLK